MREPIGVLLYTYDRVEDAYINQEIIRNVWQKSGLFGSIKIIHAYNGKKSWYPKKYLEDVVIRRSNPGHYQGATELIDSGMQIFRKQFPNIPYIVALASDTWMMKPDYVSKLIADMKKKERWLACSPWDVPAERDVRDTGISLDFFILDAKWERRYPVFPLSFRQFQKRYAELLLYVRGSIVSAEKLFLARFMEAAIRAYKKDVGGPIFGVAKMLLMQERRPVHSHIDKKGMWQRKHFWPKIGLLTHHDPVAKQRAFKTFPKFVGKHADKFRNAKNLAYFNTHVQIRGENSL